MTTSDKKLGKYLYFSKIRQDNIISYMKESKNYKSNDIDALYNTSESSEASIHYILGVLLQNGIMKLGKQDLIVLSKNEQEFRNKLSTSKNQKIQAIFDEYNIESENIKEIDSTSTRDYKRFNPYNYINLAIKNQDFELVKILRKKKDI